MLKYCAYTKAAMYICCLKIPKKEQMILTFIVIVSIFALLCSCSTQYNISGDSNVSTLDGRMLYLKTFGNDEYMVKVDSCEVIHGKFNFMGMVDSVCMGEIFMENERMMPVVIETGDISVRINDLEQRVTGSSLNDRLYDFLGKRLQMENRIMELSSKEAHLIFMSNDPLEAHEKIQKKTDELYEEIEKLETNFIINNSSNILGCSYFMAVCNQYPYPIVTPQIKEIVKKSSSHFRKLPFVRSYMNAAEKNMRYVLPCSDK